MLRKAAMAKSTRPSGSAGLDRRATEARIPGFAGEFAMNSTPHNSNPSASVPGAGEETLRLIASLPVPTGLEDRMHAALRVAPERGPRRQIFVAGVARRGRVLAWPSALTPQSSWMRTVAAAAIVFIVAGGGWGVYTRVQQNQPARVIVMPPRVVMPGGFSGAGAMRTPETLPGPALMHPVAPKHAQLQQTQPMAGKKPAKRPAATGAASPAHDAAAPAVSQ